MERYNIEKWSINETLLQAYRSIFISSQSFLLAVGAIVSDKSLVVLCVTAVISLVMIWYIWFPVVKSRHRIVDYYKYGLELDDTQWSELCEFCTENQYVKDDNLYSQANVLLHINIDDGEWRSTRTKIDLYMPILFSIVWAALVVYEISVK
jgi:hypothetical protein